jgi:predicted transcriptional regulator with HTH domain
MTEDKRLPDECQDARDALAPLLALKLVEMVMIDGVESYQITSKGKGIVGMAREMGVIPDLEGD